MADGRILVLNALAADFSDPAARDFISHLL